MPKYLSFFDSLRPTCFSASHCQGLYCHPSFVHLQCPSRRERTGLLRAFRTLSILYNLVYNTCLVWTLLIPPGLPCGVAPMFPALQLHQTPCKIPPFPCSFRLPWFLERLPFTLSPALGPLSNQGLFFIWKAQGCLSHLQLGTCHCSVLPSHSTLPLW